MMMNLKKLRLERGQTLEQVALDVGISTAHYYMIENGKRRLYYDLAVKISNHFNLKPDDIFLENYLTCS